MASMTPAPSTTPHPAILYVLPKEQVARALGDLVLKAQEEALSKRSQFTLAVSGGSLAKTLVDGLTGRAEVKWGKWSRVVPLDHEDSIVHEGLFSQVPFPTENIHPISTEPLDDPEEVAHDYEKQQECGGVSPLRSDSVRRGARRRPHMFAVPGHELLKEDSAWVSWLTDSPKPPATRITLTYPVLNHAHKVAFVVGAAKKDVIQNVLDSPQLGLPSSLVKPTPPGQVFWFVDEAAASQTQYVKTDLKL
ncbi:hypothetical protein PtA15_17A136 [Puccinia triticina]|uniref:Glucosamine/galactosamine-6-phosphate isomerase domain-containing protein n=1 Tax=Puccinia triticina TaxID=208348 RepID=A0ABY7D4V8_9BASI|nr:uncharacterized protein PtA15_17A136 [Puccinia triticina]WAQ92654.1 hypothetical protein PtA15_17A136 [Puccinia triticina]